MTIQKGQRVVSRSGFVFEVVYVGPRGITVKSKMSDKPERYSQEEFIGRFGSQMPPEFPVEKLSA